MSWYRRRFFGEGLEFSNGSQGYIITNAAAGVEIHIPKTQI